LTAGDVDFYLYFGGEKIIFSNNIRDFLDNYNDGKRIYVNRLRFYS
jgi:hypothetical protein